MDTVTKRLMKNNVFFANIFNYYLYGGKDVIKEEDLSEEDTHLEFKNKNLEFIRLRDVYKNVIIKSTKEANYLLLGIENQTSIDYSMVVRCMMYDSMSYTKQVEDLAKKYESSKIRKRSFTSKIEKEDKLKPVITLVVYYGLDEWDAAKELYEMFEISDKSLFKCISNYKMNLIDPHHIEDGDFEKFNDNLNLLFQAIKYSNNKFKLKEILSVDKKISTDVCDVMNELLKTEIHYEERGEYNMCKAWEELKQDLLDEGKAKGLEEGKAVGAKESLEANIKTMKSNGFEAEIIAKALNLELAYVNSVLESK